MINGLNEVLMNSSQGGVKKSKTQVSSSDVFEALLAILMNQTNIIQGSGSWNIEDLLKGMNLEKGKTNSLESLMCSEDGKSSFPVEIQYMLDKLLKMMDTGKTDIQSSQQANVELKTAIEDLIKNCPRDDSALDVIKEIGDIISSLEAGKEAQDGLTSLVAAKENQGVFPAGNTTKGTPLQSEVPQILKDMLDKLSTADDNSKDTENMTVSGARVWDNEFIIPKPEVMRIMKNSSEAIRDEMQQARTENSGKGLMDFKTSDFKVNTMENTSGAKTKMQNGLNFHMVQNATNILQGSKSTNQAEKVPVQAAASLKSEDVLNQVFDKIKVMNNSNMSELHVKLRPAELGELSIKLVMEKGIMTGKITVENSAVKDMIESNLPQIKENLRSHNLNVSELNVNIGQDGREFSSRSDFSWGKRHYGTRAANMDVSLPIGETAAANSMAQYSGALNLLA